jgi:hypothetical protein|tara:strand:+ start:579 stop:1412 length:834 start_codon:yes stop_codon:yes gene_type:complete
MAFTPLVQYKGKNDDRGPSPSLWADLPRDIQDPNVGFEFFDDFVNVSKHITDQDTQQYASYIDTGVTLTQLAGVVGGQLEIAGNDADNDEGVLSTHGPLAQVSDTAGNDRKLWFEARFSKASIADNGLGFFLGLAFDHGSSVPISGTLALTDDDANLGAFSYIGFHCDQADGDAIDFVYKAEGGAQTVAIAGVQVPAADTFYKFGFKYDPSALTSKRIAVYVDGTEQTTYVTGTDIAAATFPDAEPLGLVLATKVGAASEVKSQLDWWKVAQLYEEA